MNSEKTIKQQLLKHLKGGEAFLALDDFVEKMPYFQLGIVPENLPYSFFQVFWHMRYAQKDILDFCNAEVYTEVSWPKDYWPESAAPASEKEWKNLKTKFFEEREQLAEFISDEYNGLLDKAKHGGGQSLLRELMLVIEHNAYHTGQLLLIMRLLKVYP